MIHYAEVLRQDNTLSHQVPMAQYQINDSQLLAAVADYTQSMADPREDEQASWINLGSLEELNFMMKAQLVNSMLIDRWDFIKYPNPQVFLGQLKGGQDGN